MAHPFRFGIGVNNAPDGAGWRELAVKGEAAGFDVLVTSDHFDQSLAPVPALTAAAVATSRLHVGTLVFCNEYRHPLALAREAATVDFLSGGRFELGIGSGWDANDFAWLGLPFDKPSIRLARLEESVQLMRLAWKAEPFSFHGEHYTVDDYAGGPTPARAGGPLVMIGGGAPKVLALAARHADIISISGRARSDGAGLEGGSDLSLEAMSRKIAWVREAAPERFDALEVSTVVFAVDFTDDPRPVAEQFAGSFGCDADTILESPHAAIGTVAEIADKLYRLREQTGLSYFQFAVRPDQFEPFAELIETLRAAA